MSKVYIDLDGTILDISEKYYRIYYENITLFGRKPLPKDEYWKLKRNGEKEEQIVMKSGISIDRTICYNDLFSEKIEKMEYLNYDKVFSGAAQTLKTLREKGNKVILVTLRKLPINLHKELKFLSLDPLFNEILIGSHREKKLWIHKAKLIKNSACFSQRKSLIVGDTEVDILAGKTLGIKTVVVLNGMRNRALLLAKKPDYVIENINELPSMLGQIR